MTDTAETELEAHLAILAKQLAASADALRAGGGRYAKSDALQAVLAYLRASEVPDAALLPLYEIHGELADAQNREEHPGKRPPKAIKATVDQAMALAAIDFLREADMNLDEAARKVVGEVPGLGLSAKQLKELRKNAGKGRQRSEMQERRRGYLKSAHDNDWPPEEAANVMLDRLRECCRVEKKG